MDQDLIQGTDAWRLARCGSLGASQVHEALAATKTSGWKSSRANLIGQLVAERLTGIPADTYTNANMQWGIDHEAEARAQYAFINEVDVTEVGLIRHPRIAYTHASPDGLIGEDGLLEIKAPLTSTHIATILGDEPIALKYLTQMTWAMACTGRAWCDFCSFDPRLPDYARIFTQRIHRDDSIIHDMEREVEVFLREVDDKAARIRALGEK